MFADIAGEGRLTVVLSVSLPANDITTVRPKGDIAKPPKVKKPTVKPKTVVGMV